MQNLIQPTILTLATFTPAIGFIAPDLSLIAQQVSAVGVMAFFLWRETKINRELKAEIKELREKIMEMLERKG